MKEVKEGEVEIFYFEERCHMTILVATQPPIHAREWRTGVTTITNAEHLVTTITDNVSAR